MLPVELSLPEIRSALATARAAVLEAPPGAGKTTRVPVALLAEPWCQGQRIILLEPRRLAARAAARRMARERGESIGETIGLRIRGESLVGPRTRIEVVTEGVLTRLLQDDPALQNVAAVIFDEFHERSLHADTGLALVLGATRILRDDIRVLVMSATLDGGRIAALLGNAPHIRSEGRQFPVELRHDPPALRRSLNGHIATQIRETLSRHDGSILVFLPGAADIHRLTTMLEGTLPSDVALHPLYGALSSAAQDAAIQPASTGCRKVVLATNVAETSLTIDGITAVIDSGLERIPRFNPRTGMSRLETVRITKASAAQRSGRAGRTAPGIAIRCWSMAEEAGLLPVPRAAILDADLAPLALDLALAGFPDPDELPWIDPPPPGHFAAARLLLRDLGAIDQSNRVSEQGLRMARWGVHPRLSLMLTRAAELGRVALRRAAALTVLVEERDLLRSGEGPAPADIQLRLDLLERETPPPLVAARSADRATLSHLRQQLARLVAKGEPTPTTSTTPVSTGLLASWAWPDRVARRRERPGRFLMRSGRGAWLDPADPLAHAEWIVVIDVDDTGREGRIQRAAILDTEDVEELISTGAVEETHVQWDAASDGVTIRRVARLGSIILRENPVDTADPALIGAALLDGLRHVGIAQLPWSEEARHLRERIIFLHHHDPSWPDLSDEKLTDTLAEWLLPSLTGMRNLGDLRTLDLLGLLLDQLTWTQRRELDVLAPPRIEVPSGSRIAVDYADPAAPILAVRLQEVFGMRDSPRLFRNTVPVVMHLLSPARRPMQVTRDLASFWASGYFDVRRELRGRYPRHHWPEDPLTAKAEVGVKKRR